MEATFIRDGLNSNEVLQPTTLDLFEDGILSIGQTGTIRWLEFHIIVVVLPVTIQDG